MELNATGQIVQEEWLLAAEIRADVWLDAFTVMLNHIHGVIIKRETPNLGSSRAGTLPIASAALAGPIASRAGSVGAIISQFKSGVTKRARTLAPPREAIWQRGFYERIVRDETEMSRIREYIVANPLRWSEDEYYPR